ncbi:MAG: serine/threonine protein kinase [Deltaproteobacteria bacterium]|nr:serine/threonine protein kinase [Deltaproteobacteria bacterium]
MQICLACSTTTAESGRFCPACGAVLTEQADGNSAMAVAATQTAAQTGASLVGMTVDGFAIEGVVGGGAFGTVYRARQERLDRFVALKVPSYEIAADPIMARRFAREARSAARICHPGVVSIYAVGELADGRPYLAMQLLDGQPLDHILADGPIDIARALGIARQIASALSETHAAEVVHRDLKPTNIMWRRDRNGDDRITLVDFGIAVCKPGSADATRLTSGGLLGTPHYMSPEQAHGEVVDARADLYALGCLLHELLTGVPPFEGSGFEVLLAHLGRPAPRPSERNPAVSEGIDNLVLALMAKKPEDRVASADATVAMLDETLDALEGQAMPGSPPLPPRPRRPTAKTRRDRPLPRPAQFGGEVVAPDTAANHPARIPSRTRWIAVGAAGALTLAAAGFAVLELRRGDRAGSVEDEIGSSRSIKRREIFRDDGETRLRVWVPDPLVVGESRLFVELRNKLGAPIVGNQLIVTIEDPDHHATGITARPRQKQPDQFGFSSEFKQTGTYRLRIFPPEDVARSPSTFDVELEVTK